MGARSGPEVPDRRADPSERAEGSRLRTYYLSGLRPV